MDFDGAAITALTPAGQTALSPAWSPTADRIAYTRLGEGKGPVLIQRLSGGAPQVVPGTESALNITPMFSPDGQFLAYAQAGEQGTNIQVANVRDMCCVQRLTTGRFADNLSPTYAPDGQRIAFVSTRAGPPQIYVMAADGTDQELLAPFDYGVTGSSNAPEWSPDGVSLAFHREVSGGPADLRPRCRGAPAQAVVVVGPQRGPDLGARWPAHRVRLRPHGAAADLGHRHRNRARARDHHWRGGTASRMVAPARRENHQHPGESS